MSESGQRRPGARQWYEWTFHGQRMVGYLFRPDLVARFGARPIEPPAEIAPRLGRLLGGLALARLEREMRGL